ncbi:MAG: hypothetical protein IPM03_02515, partial [Sulfuritalea sp.]|nr:hypothetical protein [Sulfuritalea sp.]
MSFSVLQSSRQKIKSSTRPKRRGRKATIKANADTVRAAISEQIDRATKEREEWAAKVYKRNKTQVEFLGDGPARHESMSIGAINENRRRNAIEALTKELSELKKLDDEVSTDDGAVIVFANLNRTMDQARGAVASGNWPGSTNESMFEEILLSDMKFRGPGGRGSVTSNGLSRAMLAVVQAQQDAAEAAP